MRRLEWKNGTFDEIDLVYEKVAGNADLERQMEILEIQALKEARKHCVLLQDRSGHILSPRAFDELPQSAKESIIEVFSKWGIQSVEQDIISKTIKIVFSVHIQKILACAMFRILNSLEKFDGALNLIDPSWTLELHVPLGGKKGLVQWEMFIMQLYPWLSVSETSTNQVAEIIENEEIDPDQITRIEHNETLLDKVDSMITAENITGSDIVALLDTLNELDTYYQSPQYKRDFKDDENNLLPENLKRGVLSEDGIYNALTRGYDLISDHIEGLLSKPYWIVDILPEKVPSERGERYAEVEKFYLEKDRHFKLLDKFAEMVIKFSCYHDVYNRYVDKNTWTKNADPDTVCDIMAKTMEKGTLQFFVPDTETLIVINNDDTYLTVYNADERSINLIKALAQSVGLFVWQNADVNE